MTPAILITLLLFVLALAVVNADAALYDGRPDGRKRLVDRRPGGSLERLAAADGARRAGVDVLSAGRVAGRAGALDRLGTRTAVTAWASGERGDARLRRRPSALAARKPDKISAARYSTACSDAWAGVRWYRARYNEHRRVLKLSPAPPVEQAMNCRRLRERARYWVRAAKVNRVAVERKFTLPVVKTWTSAVRVTQRPYPGTSGWLRSCSRAEGGGQYWYGFRPWSYAVGHIGYDSTGDTVFGRMQIRFTTFEPVWWHMLNDLRSRGFKPPALGWLRTELAVGASTGYEPWLSPLGQALVAGYMRYYDKDGNHWAASHGAGC